MPDFTQFFNPSAFGSWNQPNQSMVGPKPVMPMAGAGGGAPGMAQPGAMPAQPGGGGSGMGGLMSLLGGAGAGGGGPLGALMSKLGGGAGGPMDIRPPAQQPQGGGMMSGITGNPMLAKFGGALMNGQNPLQAMAQNPGDFAKWMAQRRQAQPGVQANPVGNPQSPVPTQQPGMLGGMY